LSDRVEQQHEEVLVRVVDVLDRAGIPFALMGGLAAATVGRERSTKDVDLFLTWEDAESALAPLADAGFRTERTDPGWLFKAFWGESLVDLIFESSGGILFDDEVRSHLRQVSVRGRQVPALSPEDIVIIKALANAEHRPRHWHDALAVIATTELDWGYFGRRARPYAPRVVSLLLYAVSDGAELPAEPLRELFEEAMRELPVRPETEGEHHLAARVREALATNPEIAEPDLAVVVVDHHVIVRGEVATAARRAAIEELLGRLGRPSSVRAELEVSAP
jgi:hypothetical protein